MRLKSIELSGFKSFAKKTPLEFGSAITAIVGPNGSGKSNIAESFRFVLGEQSMKSMRGKRGEDLIWNGSTQTPRAGRAGVKLLFDNSDRALNLDFDEVSIERVVHRDGGNDYLLNGSQVRLRDTAELLSQANIGASGHHIISQGESDRVLSSSPRERREMVEDALGLTAYLYKREEAERKLEKTAENMREVEALRRELMPHLKFLAGQVKKIEDAHALRDELSNAYLEYLKRESVYLRVTEDLLREEKDAPEKEHRSLDTRVEHLRKEVGKKRDDKGSQELISLERKGREAASKREAATRELGRLEGELAARAALQETAGATVPAANARAFAQRVEEEAEAIGSLELEKVKTRLAALTVLAKEFLRRIAQGAGGIKSGEDLERRKVQLEKELNSLRQEEEEVREAVAELRAAIESEKDMSRESERELFSAMARRSELEATLTGLRARAEMLTREREQLKTETREAGVLCGPEAMDYETHVVITKAGERVSDAEIAEEERGAQEDRRRKLERVKIRLEESGTGNADEVLKEHNETTQRDAFLARELEDLARSAQSLKELIAELTKTLETRFSDGIGSINKEFDTFFKLMFGGGSAALSIVREKKLRRGAADLHAQAGEGEEEDEEDVEVEEGVDIAISLPHKRIKGLHMLSGGERALTSIALIFAMSQVNPPPFLILDETDAALDEANSRRYGDMISTLAKKSQLILITHNRETMSRAGILYGITMGSDGVSKLLSVKFEEALAVTT
jgi:chromosome segregation protein